MWSAFVCAFGKITVNIFLEFTKGKFFAKVNQTVHMGVYCTILMWNIVIHLLVLLGCYFKLRNV